MVALEILTAFAFAAAVSPALAHSSPWKQQQHPHYLPGLHDAICPFKQLSCHNTTAIDTCCLESPGGLVLQTQFWDTTIGPKHHWTIHGLWPDFCDGTYPSNCDASREYTNITKILEHLGEWDLLEYMDKYWLNTPLSGVARELWEHEWAKHGTCMSTLEPRCYRHYEAGDEVVDYFTETVKVFKTLDTYKELKRCHILPSKRKRYKLSHIQSCLTRAYGALPSVGCNKTTGEMNEVWVFHHVKGKIYGGTYVPSDSTTTSTCPAEVKYLPK